MPVDVDDAEVGIVLLDAVHHFFFELRAAGRGQRGAIEREQLRRAEGERHGLERRGLRRRRRRHRRYFRLGRRRRRRPAKTSSQRWQAPRTKSVWWSRGLPVLMY